MILRRERGGEAGALSALTMRAFALAAHASGTEAAILERLRRDGDLLLLAEEAGVPLTPENGDATG